VSHIKKTATIDASAGEVFEYIDDPRNLPKYVPNVSAVVDVHQTDKRVGDTFTVIYKVLGLTFEEKFTTTEYARPTLINLAFKGGMGGSFRWSIAPRQRGCEVTVQVDYEVAGGVLGKAADSIMLERTNTSAIEGLLDNLRRLTVQSAAPG
jgi:ribosome-associated toxin RatA of RatAB toxin-antitoxin module